MKRYLLLLIISIIILPLFGKITIDHSIPNEYRSVIEKAIESSIEGRRDVNVVFDSFSLENDLVSFSLSVDDECYNTTVPIKYLEKEIKNILFYSQPLFSPSDNKLDYISDLSFSTISSPFLKRGDLVFVKDEKNNNRGVFVAFYKHKDAVDLDALYLSSPFPGMKIEKARGIEAGVSYSVSPFTYNMSIESGVSFYTPLYPLLPYCSVGSDIERGKSIFFLGVGGRTMFNLSSLWGDVPILKNMSIDGKVELILRIKEKVEIKSRWNINGVWRPLSWLSISLGYTYDAIYKDMVSLSLGALI